MEKELTYTNLMDMEQRKRANLINCIGGFKSLCLIGTVNNDAKTNLAIFNSIVHIGANPPLIGFVIRPDSVDRHTLANILETNYFTINHVNQAIYKQAHQTSARYPKDISEFNATGLTPDYKNTFTAPFVKQSLIQIGLEFKQRIDIALNSTIIIIGQIKVLYFPNNCLCEDGFLDIEKANTITCSGLDSYHLTKRFDRLAYSKPNTETQSVTLNYLA